MKGSGLWEMDETAGLASTKPAMAGRSTAALQRLTQPMPTSAAALKRLPQPPPT